MIYPAFLSFSFLEFIIHLDLSLGLQLLVLGLVAGFLAGLLGIGGSMVMAPFLTYSMTSRGLESGLAIKMAIATSMATILLTSLSSVWAHHKRGAVRWDIFKTMAPGIVTGGLLASLGVFAWLKGTSLAIFFALFVGFSATQMIVKKKTVADRQLPGAWGCFGVGSGIGFFSGLVGAGGGFISVPFLTRCNVVIHHAVATSAAFGFPIALGNVIGFVVGGLELKNLPSYSWGYVWLPGLLFISLTSVFLAPVGAKVAHGMDVSKLKKSFAVLLYMLAGYMLYKGLVV